MSSIPTVPSWRWHTAEVMAPMAVLIPIFSTEQHHQANNISAKWKIYGQMTSTLEIGMQQNFQWHQLQLVFFPLHPLSPLDKFLPLPLFQHVENRERLDNFVSFASCSTSWKQRLDKKNFLLTFFSNKLTTEIGFWENYSWFRQWESSSYWLSSQKSYQPLKFWILILSAIFIFLFSNGREMLKTC